MWDTPAVNSTANAVYVGTGNNYTTPDDATACEKEAAELGTSDASCTAPNDYFDSVLAVESTVTALIRHFAHDEGDQGQVLDDHVVALRIHASSGVVTPKAG